MFARMACLLSLVVLCGAGFNSAFFLGYRVYAAEAETKPLKSHVVNWDDAQLQQVPRPGANG
jgi:hypothetical protein